MDAEDLAQVTDSLRKAVQGDLGAARQAVTSFGWHDLLEEDMEGAVRSLFPVVGELLPPGSFLDDVLIAAAGGTEYGAVRVVLPAPGRVQPTSRMRADADVLADGLVQAGEGTVLVPCLGDEGQIRLVRCADVAVDGPGESLDADSGWTVLRRDVTASATVDDPGAWSRMVLAGRRALAHELVAVGDSMVRLTVEHVTSREQFGQRLASFQAVKHQLADVHLWREAAVLSAEAAWEQDVPESGALAKAAACRFSRSARAVCQQLLGGMGFTWEHDFHRYLRRALTLEPLLGDAPTLHAELGAALRAGSLSDSLAPL